MNVSNNNKYDEFIRAYETLINDGAISYYNNGYPYSDKSNKEIKFIRMLQRDIDASCHNGCYDGSVFRNRIMKANDDIIMLTTPILKALNDGVQAYKAANHNIRAIQNKFILKGNYIVMMHILRLALFSSHSQWIHKLDIHVSIMLFTLGINDISTDYRKYANIQADNDDIMSLARIINTNDYNAVKNRLSAFIMTNRVSYLNDFDLYILMRTRTPYDNHAIIEMINDNHLGINDIMSNAVRNDYIMTKFIQNTSMADAMRVLNADLNKNDYDNAIMIIKNIINNGYYDGSCMNNQGEYVLDSGFGIIRRAYDNCIMLKKYNQAIAIMMIAYYMDVIADNEDMYNAMNYNLYDDFPNNKKEISSLSALMVIIQNSTGFYEYLKDYPHEFIIESITALASNYEEEFKNTHKTASKHNDLYDF